MKSRHSREDANLAVDFYQHFLRAHLQRKELNIEDKKECNMSKFVESHKKYSWTFFENTPDNRKMLHNNGIFRSECAV